MLTKSEAREIRKGHYIPDGERFNLDKNPHARFRRTTESEVFRCGTQTGVDIQSGPHFCGDIAEWIFYSAKGVVALCPRHAPPKSMRLE